MSSITLLDVGHGNCTIVKDGEQSAVIDSPTGAMLLDTLEDMGITTVSAAIISHADRDHIAGVLALLTSNRFRVERIYVNPNSQKRSKVWNDFRVAVSVAERKGACEIITSLSSATPGKITVGSIAIAVVAPSAALALTGVGGETAEKRLTTTNTLSAVLRVDKGGGNGVLLAGDMDAISLDDAIAAGADMSANVLVFPHHGGLPGSTDPAAFAAKLLGIVQPKAVVFSNGRGRHDSPRPEIVGVVAQKGCSIACTQLSERCQSVAVDAASYLEPIRAIGKNSSACCAGSVTLTFTDGASRLRDADARHQEFISSQVATPMCRMRVVLNSGQPSPAGGPPEIQ